MSLYFPGSDNNYLNHTFTLNRSQGTIVCWLRFVSAGSRVIYYEGSSSTADGFGGSSILEVHTAITADPYWYIMYQDGAGIHSNNGGPSLLSTDTWYHLAATWNTSGFLKTYVNGSLDITPQDMSGLSFSGISTNYRYIGTPPNKTKGRVHYGDLAEHAVYDRELSAEEIAYLATGVRPIVLRPQFYLPMVREYTNPVGDATISATGTITVSEHPRVFQGVALPLSPPKAPNTLLYDEFTTSDAAPITDPRTCEPGPGTLDAVDASVASIDTGELAITGAQSWNSGLKSGTSFTLAEAKAFVGKKKIATNPSGGVSTLFGVIDPTETACSPVEAAINFGSSPDVVTLNKRDSAGAISLYSGSYVVDEWAGVGVLRRNGKYHLYVQGGIFDGIRASLGTTGRWYPLGTITDGLGSVDLDIASYFSNYEARFDDVGVYSTYDFGPMRAFDEQGAIGSHVPLIHIVSDTEWVLLYNYTAGAHVSTSTVIKLTRTTDSGETWSAPSTLVSAPGGSDGINNGGVLELADGRILYLWNLFGNTNTHEGVIKFAFSSDDLATLGTTYEMSLTNAQGNFIFNNPIQLSSGRVIVPYTYKSTSGSTGVYQVRIAYTDNITEADPANITWTDVAVNTANTDFNETAIAEESDGTILLVARQNGGSWLGVGDSSDNGANWNWYGESNIPNPGSRTSLLTGINSPSGVGIIGNNSSTARRNGTVWAYGSRSGAAFNSLDTWQFGDYGVDAKNLQYPIAVVHNTEVHLAWGYEDSSLAASSIIYDRTLASNLPAVSSGTFTVDAYIDGGVEAIPLSITHNRKPRLPILNRSHPLARGMLGAWLMYEGAGEVLHDASGRGFHGTFISNPTWTNDRALNFPNAGTSYVDIGNSDVLNPTGGLTLFGVVRMTQFDSTHFFIGRDDNTLGRSYALGPRYASGQKVELQINGNATIRDLVGQKILSTDTWYTIAATGDPDIGWKVYVDGELDASAAWLQPNTTTGPTTIGARSYSGAEAYFYGDVLVAYIYDRSMTAKEMRQLHLNPYAPLFSRIVMISSTVEEGAQPMIIHLPSYRRRRI